MDDAAWKKRAYDAGLTNARLGELLGMMRPAVSRLYNGPHARGLPQYVKALIAAWELLPVEAQMQLVAEMVDEAGQIVVARVDDPTA